MPERAHRYVNRSAEYRAAAERDRARKRASWERMKAAAAAKYDRSV